MTEQELNERLFDIVLPNIWPGKKHSYQQSGGVIAVWVTDDFQNTVEYFSPAPSVDDLRKYVLPEIERRGLFRAWIDAIADGTTDKELDAAFAATGVLPADFAVDPQESGYVLASIMWGAATNHLAAAALAVLEADNAK